MRMLKALCLAVGLAYNPFSFAGDIAREVRNAGNSPLTENGGYFELGIGLTHFHIARIVKDPNKNNNDQWGITIHLNGEYRYNGFFIEAPDGSFDGINLGYSLWTSESWQLDFLAGSISGAAQSNNEISETDSEQERDNKILDRDSLYYGLGFRLTGYLGDTIVQYRLVTDAYDDNGEIYSLRLGKHWQHGNWNFHGIIGANYLSAKTNQYNWGVPDQAATSRFPAFKAEAGFSAQLELGAVYPISEHWVFRASARYDQLPVQVLDSPLLADDHFSRLRANLTYVF